MTPDNDSRPTADVMAELATQAGRFADAALDLRAAYRLSRQLKVIFVVAFLMLAAIAVVVLQNYSTGQSRTATINAIHDCTSPGGDCYQRAQQATAKAITQIVASINAHTDLVFFATIECTRTPALTGRDLVLCLQAHGVQSGVT